MEVHIPQIVWQQIFQTVLTQGKIVPQFLIRTHFISVQDNITIKQQINHGTIQKVCHLHSDIFHLIYLCHILSVLLYYLPCVIH